MDQVRAYASHLSEAYMLREVPRFAFKLSTQSRSPRKVYATDVGLRNAVAFRFSEDLGRLAETVSNYLAMGRRIGVDGRLSWREWEAQDGTKRQSVEVIANDIFFLDNRGEGEGGGGGGWSAQAAPATPGGDLPVDTSDLSSPAPAPAGDDDIPF
jgi:single stranded DNA-binding protein